MVRFLCDQALVQRLVAFGVGLGLVVGRVEMMSCVPVAEV